MTSVESSSSSSTSLLEKYANLHTDLEQARQETTQCLLELQSCQKQIQNLLEQRSILQETTSQACQEQERLHDQVQHITDQLENLQVDYVQAMTRQEHAHHVQVMIQRRGEIARKDYDRSIQKFFNACQQFLGKMKKPVDIPMTEADTKVYSTGSRSSLLFLPKESNNDKENSIENSKNYNDCDSNTNLLKFDWVELFSQVLAGVDDEILQDVTKQSLIQDSKIKDQQDAPTDATSISLESRNVDDVDENHCENRITVTEEIISQIQDMEDTPAPIESGSLFTQCLHVIERIYAAKESTGGEAQLRLSAAQVRHDQAMQDYEEVYKEHKTWLSKISRQRTQKEQLLLQLERLQNEVTDLQQQMDHVHSQTLELQQEMQSGMCYQSNQCDYETPTHPHYLDKDHKHGNQQRVSKWKGSDLEASKHTLTTSRCNDDGFPRAASDIFNPYLPSKRKAPLNVAEESMVTTACRLRSCPTSTNERAISRNRERNSSSGAVISPFEENKSLASDNSIVENPDSQHPHRVGRVRMTRDFGVSLSLESLSSSMLSNPRNAVNDVATTTPQPTFRSANENAVEFRGHEKVHHGTQTQHSSCSTRCTPRDEPTKSAVASTTKRLASERGLGSISEASATSVVYDSSDDDDNNNKLLQFVFRK